jgi:hypothetical protein
MKLLDKVFPVIQKTDTSIKIKASIDQIYEILILFYKIL